MLTAERLRELLDYDPETGTFRWRRRMAPHVPAGRLAGGRRGKGYVYIRIERRDFSAHRLAWLWVTGAWPLQEIDHRNRVRSDNRWSNLRECSPSQNHANSKLQQRSRARFKGVSLASSSGKWMARITVAGELKFLGRYDTREEAHAAYAAAARKAFGEFARLE